MLGAAKTDLEPYLARRERKQRAAIANGPLLDFEFRQTLLDQTRMIGAQLLAAAASVKRAPRRVGGRFLPGGLRRNTNQETRPRNWLTRSVFSHEKPPSASGGRPKWPYAEVRA